jgi:hypothetical protein
MRFRHRPLVLALLLAALPVSAGAEIVVFAHGGFLKVASFEVTGERVRLELPSGGRLVMPMERVERILEDEIVDEPEEVVAAPAFEIGFDPAHPRPETPYGELIYRAAERHGLNPSLVAAVVRAESAFRADAVSVKGARGLMQLMPATARRFGLGAAEIHDPERNLEAGARYLRLLADRFEGRLPLLLAAYNAGEGTVDRYRGVPPYRETRDYLRRIYTFLGLSEVELSAELAAGSSPAVASTTTGR